MQDVPHKPPNAPTRDDIATSDILLQVDWQPLENPENGGADIISYNLQYDDASGGNTWTDLTGVTSDEVILSSSVTNSIQVGLTYLFRYRAKNAHGWGEFSDSLSLIAARRAD